jgi:imidazole glycerol-phosphate synthase subunit HisF
MLKRRIAANVIVKDGIVIQSINFRKYLPIGKPSITIEFLNLWGIDEIILLDISAGRQRKSPDFEMVRRAAKKCFVPLTVGGGIRSIEDIRELVHSGADKVSLNQAALHQPGLISEGAHVFGNQCMVVSIDAVKINNEYKVYDYLQKKPIDLSPSAMARKVIDLGAGEILINSVDRDGSYAGYDLELIKSVCDVSSVPVICCGGAKNARDFVSAFKNTDVSAASAGNFFHFTEHSVNTSKAKVIPQINIRLETAANYVDSRFDEESRLLKKADADLEAMLYVRIEKEII